MVPLTCQTWLPVSPSSRRTKPLPKQPPHPMLDNRAPLEVALATGLGADAVINLLGRAAYSGGV